MILPPLRPDEPERLAALRALGLLGTPREDRFDRLVRITRDLFDVPICLISLVDEDEQWFKACIGLDIDGTERSVSFCTHAIMEPVPLVVPDATVDPRFASNRLVTGDPFIRFYAGHPFRSPDGFPIGTLCIIDRRPRTLSAEQLDRLRDLAGLVERELHASARSEAAIESWVAETRYRNLINGLSHAMVLYNQEGQVISCNVRAEALLGFRADDLAAGGTVELRGEDGRILPLTGEGSLAREALLTGVPVEDRVTSMTDSSGRTRWLSVWCNPFSVGHALQGVVCTYADVTERLQAEDERKQLKNRLQLVLDSIHEGIFGVNNEGLVTFLNPAAERLLGVAPGSMVGLHYTDVIRPEQPGGATGWQDPVKAILSGEADQESRTTVLVRERMAPLPVEMNYARKLDGLGVVVHFRDVTERLESERIKSEFISVVSHELRTPLTSIRGALGILAGGTLGTLSERGQRMLQIAAQNTERLVRLINDILDIERIESGKSVMDKRPCEATYLVRQTVESLQSNAEQAGLRLDVEVEPVEIVVDPDRIVQVLTNLIGNAIKFSPPGTCVTVRCHKRPGNVLFEVADQGRGIPADKLGVIFERFRQVDASDSRVKGGSGLGLAISRSIVEQHGGTIWVQSQVGQGSTFAFTIPLEASLPDNPAPNLGNGRRVVICYDDESMGKVVRGILEQYGFDVLDAHNGPDVVATALAISPAAILLDLDMPGMTGLETVRELKRHPGTADLPVLVFSGSPAMEESESAEGVVEWLRKPVHGSVLIKRLERAIAAAYKGATVLIVEDDVSLAAVISAGLEQLGLATRSARGVSEAVQVFESGRIDLIILDVMLADGVGHELVDWLQAHPEHRKVPVVVYTGADLDPIARGQLQLGRTEFLSKGLVSPEKLAERVVELAVRFAKARQEGKHGSDQASANH